MILTTQRDPDTEELVRRRHIISKRRSLDREVGLEVPLDEQSAYHLADVLLAREPAPGARLLREELLYRVRKAVNQLPSEFREVLILRQIEQLSVEEIAAVLAIPEGTVKSRHFRALAHATPSKLIGYVFGTFDDSGRLVTSGEAAADLKFVGSDDRGTPASAIQSANTAEQRDSASVHSGETSTDAPPNSVFDFDAPAAANETAKPVFGTAASGSAILQVSLTQIY